ncbi:element excision factor XisH family protein [Nodularia spumigena CS-591/04]|uniref:element excision factor XisH family protein n=1 Tax=Nodularia spumigena TaxID=70799 RepID=UPI00232B790E|nr:element excision factor XisH family protein [Nodularia spumigena]MDB9323561.1 element excision factor XisH family protein [Nodularia spumigena CS-591/07A]MDB9332640.1 element excision factor XisH family protein [Nodularia spumigena CS-591/04]MDB9360774.1 element excision factor XisH family protein [Nodularia spumigena CS-588/02]MDB9367082.1 element excision factor XisH family protein [Nodularia spumigena CS-588/02A10]
MKSFTRPSDLKDLEDAVGQFVLYEHLLARYYPEYKLFLAVSESTCKTVFEEEAGQTLIEDGQELRKIMKKRTTKDTKDTK